MTDLENALSTMQSILEKFQGLIERVNGGKKTNTEYKYPVLFPDLSPQGLQAFHDNLSQFGDLVKNDLGKATYPKGELHFKALTKLFETNPQYLKDPNATDPAKKIKPIAIFRWPPPDSPQEGWGWGATILLQLSAFSLEYDLTPNQTYYTFTFKHIQIALEFKSYDSPQGAQGLKTVFTTPAIDMTVEIKIPQNINTGSLPDINFSFLFGFHFTLNLNFDWPTLNFSFAPFNLYLPDWLGFNLPIDLGAFFNLKLSCDWTLGLILPDGFRIRWPDINWGKIKLFLLKMCGWLGFDFSKGGLDYFTQVQYGESSGVLPEWAAVFLDISFLEKVFGGYKPDSLFLMLGVNTADGVLKVGLLTYTGNLPLLNKAFMIRGALQYNFEYKSNGDSQIETHPGFELAFIGGADAAALATAMFRQAPGEPEISCSGFAARLDRLGMLWDKDLKEYVAFVDGKFTIKQLLHSVKEGAQNKDLELPFKGLGFTPSGQFVMKKSWISLPEAMQVKLDDVKQIALFLSSYGYEKLPDKPFWIGFSGQIRLPVLNIGAGVDRLIIYSDGTVELSGIYVDVEIPKVVRLAGAVVWGDSLTPPNLPPGGTKVSGFAGLLRIDIYPISFGCLLGFSYVKVPLPPGELIAWSFFGEVVLPATIPVCVAIGFYSLGMMVGKNYQPRPKQLGLPHDRWLEQGFDNDAENIMNTVQYWGVAEDAFAAGLSVGLATVADQGFILRSKAIVIFALPGPLVMIAGKADVLRPPQQPLIGIFNLLIIYDQSDPGLLASLSFRYDIKYLVTIQGMAELYFDFEDAGRWHFFLGTPEKPVALKAFYVFDASGYLMIDARHLAIGAKVYYGYNWSAGPLAVKAYICFYGNLEIGWNPLFLMVKVGVKGEIGVRIFGFGLGASLAAELQIKCAQPWYLFAMVEAQFSISFFFFSFSFTVHFELEWGSDQAHPDPELGVQFDTQQVVKSLTSSLSSNASLQPGSNATDQTSYLPMDGVLSCEFARDVEIIQGNNPPPLREPYFIQMNDEESPHAQTKNRFRLQLKDFTIEQETAPNVFQVIPRTVFFSWSPLDEKERKKLVTREFDMGYSQFRLNEDPNAFVRLWCPDLFQAVSPLVLLWKHPDLKADTAFPGGLVFHCQPDFIGVDLSRTPNGPESYRLDYQGTTARLFTNGVIPVDQSGHRIRLLKGMTLEFVEPAACLMFSIEPVDALPAGVSLDPQVYFKLYDENGLDISAVCLNHAYPLPGSSSWMVVLNDFEDSPHYLPRDFMAQQPPAAGIKTIKLCKSGILNSGQNQNAYFTMFPLQALREVHTRNLERVRQQAQLEYLFEQTSSPEGNLWEPGKYRVKGKALWWVNNDTEEQAKDFVREFTVVPPFDPIKVTTAKGDLAVQPLDTYLRRITPMAGSRAVYRDQLPGVTFRCNYLNAMLKKGEKRLALLLFDSNGQPCRYTDTVIDYFIIPDELAGEFQVVARNAPYAKYKGMQEIDGQFILAANAAGRNRIRLDSLKATGLENTLRKAGILKPGVQTLQAAAIDSNELLQKANRLQLERRGGKDPSGRSRSKRLENLLRRSFEKRPGLSEAQLALVFAGKGRTVIGVVRVVHGLVEYRYTNDDLKLDVSSLQLADCLGNAAQQLNAYERGYFAPILPNGVKWEGLSPQTRYTARMYCLGANEQINAVPASPALHSFAFTTSRFTDVTALLALFPTGKKRDSQIKAEVLPVKYDELPPHIQPFQHPGNQNINLHLGCDIYRRLDAAPAPAPPADAPFRQQEEAFVALWEQQVVSLKSDRLKEGLVFDALIDQLNIELESLQSERLDVTWLRLENVSNGGLEGTLGVLLDFPEPLDWERCAIRIDHLEVTLNDSGQTIDLLNISQTDPNYEIRLHWARSQDSTRLILMPEILHTRLMLPEIKDLFPSEYTRADIISPVNAVNQTEGQPTQPKPRRRVRLGDAAVPSLRSVASVEKVNELYGQFGRRKVGQVLNYTVSRMELSFFSLADNYEKGRPQRRAIPRLQYREGDPTGADGLVGVLKLM